MSKFSCLSFVLNHRLVGYSFEKREVFLVSRLVETSLKVAKLEPIGTIPVFHLAT